MIEPTVSAIAWVVLILELIWYRLKVKMSQKYGFYTYNWRHLAFEVHGFINEGTDSFINFNVTMAYEDQSDPRKPGLY